MTMWLLPGDRVQHNDGSEGVVEAIEKHVTVRFTNGQRVGFPLKSACEELILMANSRTPAPEPRHE